MLESTKGKIIATIALVIFGAITLVLGVNQSQATKEEEQAERARELARIEAVDKLNEGIVADFNAVKEGMGRNEVLELVGEPYQKDIDKSGDFKTEMWSYGGKGIIVFVNGRVQMTSY